MIRSKDNFLQVSDGAWIYFEDYGKDKGEPIMILHGFLCSSKFFYKNIDALSVALQTSCENFSNNLQKRNGA